MCRTTCMLKFSRLFFLLSLVILGAYIGSRQYFGVLDSLAFWGGVQVFLEGGDPYDFGQVSQFLSSHFTNILNSQRFVSPPWTLALLTPIFAADFERSRIVLSIISLTLYLFSVYRLTLLWGRIPWLGVCAVWAYLPLWVCLYFGQISVLLLLGVVLALEWIQGRDQPWWKWALALALLALKPQGSLLVMPFLFVEGIRRLSRREWVALVGCAGVTIVVLLPFLRYLPAWLETFLFSSSHRTATLSVYVQDAGALLGYHSALWLWVLPMLSLVTLVILRVRINDATSFLLVLMLSQLTASYVWVYDSCALMPLFYAMIGAAIVMKEPMWRRALGIVSLSIAVFPVYLVIDSDFSFMRMHNLAMSIAALALLPGLRSYLTSRMG